MSQVGYTPISLYYSTTASTAPTAGNLVAGELAINTTDGKLYYKDTAGVVQTLATKDTTAGTFTSISDSGNLTFTGTGNRITGDFSNATFSNRVAFQSSTTNGNTAVSILPNGTATGGYLNTYNNSDPTNSSAFIFGASVSEAQIQSTIRGTGTYLPLTMYTGGSERLRIDTNGLVGIGLTPSGSTVKLQVSTDASISGLTVGKGGGSVSTNTAVGVSALTSNTSGATSTALGYQSGYTNTTGILTAVGYRAGYNANTGTLTAFGYQAGYNNTGSDTVAIGTNAVYTNTSGNYNVGIGRDALYSNTTASNNTAVGYQAGYNNTTGLITALGFQAGYSNTTSQYSTFVGRQASLWTTGGYNTAVGDSALAGTSGTSTGANNTALGYAALFANTTASNNTAVGYQAAYANTTGSLTAIGMNSLYSNTTGVGNIAVGGVTPAVSNAALQSNTTGTYNIAMGSGALTANTTGSSNVGIGHAALISNTTASNNTAVGYQALYSNTTGTPNVAVGAQALYSQTTGNNNCAVGYYAGNAVTTGTYNSLLGHGAGYLITTGGKNTVVGAYSGNQGGLDIRTASNYIVLSDGDGNPRGIFESSGRFVLGTSASLNNGFVTILHDGSATQGISIRDSNASGGNALFFTNSAGSNVGSIATTSTVTAYNVTSDRRLKENIAPLTGGLVSVLELKPSQYNYIADPTTQMQGFIADELQQIVPHAVTGEANAVDKEGNPIYQAVDSSFLIPHLVAAIQEQQAIIEQLKAKVGL